MPQRRGVAGPAAALLGGGAVVLLGFADGGYFPRSWPPAALGFAAAAGLAALARPALRFSASETFFVGALAVFAAWQALSTVWSLEPADSLREAERGSVYVAASLAFLAVGRRGRAAWLLVGLAGGAVVIAVYSVVDRLVEGPREAPFQGTLLIEPLGYANALGLMAALGLVSAVGIAAAAPKWWLLALVGPVLAVFAAALHLTASRGSWLAGAVGIGTLLVFRFGRTALRGAWLLAVGVAVVAVLLTPLVVSPTTLERALSDRPYFWWTAWQAIPDYPLLGSGAGTFDVLWAALAPIPVDVRDAHSLFLETLVELGPLGLALAAAAMLGPLLAALRLQATWPSATAAGAYVAFLVHASFDWDWEMPAVTIFGLGCGAALLLLRVAEIRDLGHTSGTS